MSKTPSDKDKKRFKQAMEALNGGDPKDAIRLFEKVSKTGGSHPDIWYLLGLAHGKMGAMKKVKQVSIKALQIKPNHFGALCNLANALFAMGDTEGALDHYHKALKESPNDPTVINNYGRALGHLGKREEAIEHFKNILKRNPNYAAAHVSLAKAYSEGGHPDEALNEYQAALRIDPNMMEVHIGIGGLYSGLGGLPYAIHHYNIVLKKEPNNNGARLGLASVKRFMGAFDEAMEHLEIAEKHEPNAPGILACKANLLERKASYNDAHDIILKLKKNNQMTPLAISVYSSLCHKFDSCEEAIKLLNDGIAAPYNNIMDKQMLRFDAGRLHDKLKRYDDAFDFYQKANKTVAVPSKLESDKKLRDKLISFYSKENLQKLPRATTGSSRPIFILGMPRSGTSLTEQIIASHQDVHGAGELAEVKMLTNNMLRTARKGNDLVHYMDILADYTEQDMNKYAKQYLESIKKLNADAKYVTDKMPHNFLHVGLISLLFPDAHIIHCRRNALDNALSIFFQNFSWTHDYAIDLAHIGKFYKVYDSLMKHWEEVVDIPMMTVNYEDMVEDQEATSRKLIEFCGLEWNDDVLNFHGSKRTIATASYNQVNQPIYKSSKERWRNYEDHLGPLIDELKDLL